MSMPFHASLNEVVRRRRKDAVVCNTSELLLLRGVHGVPFKAPVISNPIRKRNDIAVRANHHHYFPSANAVSASVYRITIIK